MPVWILSGEVVQVRIYVVEGSVLKDEDRYELPLPSSWKGRHVLTSYQGNYSSATI